MRGEWLKPRQLKAMKTTVFDSDYGLGIEKLTASCGKELWGHGGGWVGSLSYAATTEDGRHSFALNLNGDWDAAWGGGGAAGRVLRHALEMLRPSRRADAPAPRARAGCPPSGRGPAS